MLMFTFRRVRILTGMQEQMQSVILQSFSIGLTRFLFHLTDVAIHLTDVSFQLTDISLQLTEALLYKLGVNLKQNLKAIGKLFSARFVFECFPSSSLDKDASLNVSPWLKCFHKAPINTGKCFIHHSQSSFTTLLNLRLYSFI